MSDTLAVVLDLGAATPLRIADAAEDLCDLVFVCDPASAYVRTVRPLMEELAPVLDVHDPALNESLRAAGVTGVVAFSDPELVPSARIAAALGLRGHDLPTAQILVDKELQRAALAGVPGCGVRFVTIDDPADAAAVLEELGLPAIVKPRRGAGSRNTVRVESVAALAAAVTVAQASGDHELIVEELLIGDPSVAGPGWGDYVSVESVIRNGVVCHLGVTGKWPLVEPYREQGIFYPSTLPDDVQQETCELVERAITGVGVRWGMCHTEVKFTAQGPRLIEVNGRMGGYVDDIYERATGVGLIELAMAEALGRTSSQPPTARRIAYQLGKTSPIGACRVEAVRGVQQVRGLPDVTRLDLIRPAGSPVDWRAGTSSWVAVLHGTVVDHLELADLHASFDSCLEVDYSWEGGLDNQPRPDIDETVQRTTATGHLA